MKASIAIAAELRNRIAGGSLPPGAPLPVEDDLTAEFGCSKPVVREALRILETEGLLEVKRGIGGGPRVRHPSVGHAASGMGVYLSIGDVAVLDVWETRDRIVAGAVERLAAEQVDLAPLERAVAAMAEAVGDLAGFNGRLLDVAEVAVDLAGSATEALLVAALRHLLAAEVATATARVQPDEDDEVAMAVREQEALLLAWRRTLRLLRAGRGRPARRAYEGQAAVLRQLVAEGARVTLATT
jgi:GntR family transcriptional regulator, transcriptional repressor for pyruvate dehydrogenase complex